MNYIDFIIIYLTCGAPFGVYYFLQQRDKIKLGQNVTFIWLKCGVITFFWFPFAIKLLQRFVTNKLQKSKFAETNQVDSSLKEKIEVYEKEVLQILLIEKIRISPFEFRETLERFVGLTLNCSNKIKDSNVTISEFYEINTHENAKLATICLNRRNRLRLQYHQTLASRDFLRLIEKINAELVENEIFSTLSIDFATLFEDIEFTAKLKQIFDTSTQNEYDFIVTEREQYLWNPIKPKPRLTNETTLNLPTISTTATMLKRD